MKGTSSIKLNQLKIQSNFIYFCNTDHNGTMNRKLGTEITEEFLNACEKDEFVLPLFSEIKKSKDQMGNEVSVKIKYYSPFQLFIVAELCKNSVNSDGFLYDESMSKIMPPTNNDNRSINWGGSSSFNVSNRKTQDEFDVIPNHHSLAKYLHSFLEYLHALDTLEKKYPNNFPKERLYQDLPKLHYDFSELKKTRKFPKKYNINLKRLEVLLKTIGSYALYIDPLQDWYYYINKHELIRRDRLKGLAGVAQELYNFCDLLKEAIEILKNEKLQPFIEYINDGHYMQSEQINEYVIGNDILVIKKSAEDLQKWLEKNIDKFNSIASQNQQYIATEDYEKQVQMVIKLIESFIEKYGDLRSVNGCSTNHLKNFTLDELDSDVRRVFNSIGRNYKIKNDNLPKEILSAIERRMSELKYFVAEIVNNISNRMNDIKYPLQHEKQHDSYKYAHEYQLLHKDEPNFVFNWQTYYKEYLPIAQKSITDTLDLIEILDKDLIKISRSLRLVYCGKCRRNFVMTHQVYGDQKISNEAICDECIDKGDLQNIKDGEWKCNHKTSDGKVCGNILHKFAHGNILNTNLFGGSNLNIILNYGQIQVEVKCNKCKNISKRTVDWGWLQ